MSQNDRLTEDEIRDYGEEFLSVVGKAARQATSGQVQQLQQTVGQLQTTIYRNNREAMKAELDRDIPSWRDINENPRFLEALEKTDDYTGYKYMDLLKHHWKANNVEQVKNFFSKAASDMNNTMPQPPQNQPRNKEPVYRDQTGYYQRGNPPGPQGRIITRAEIQKHHDDIVRGRYAGRDAERKAMDEAICAASREGRIK